MHRPYLMTLILILTSSLCDAVCQDFHTRVILDRGTFPASSYALMSRTANRVAKVVDQLIPGKPDWPPATSITCFVAKDGWTARPITLLGSIRPGEPRSSQPKHIRIAVTSNVLPGAYQRFAFQLAHELAHVKMDPRVDNKIVETLAVAISLEVIERMGYHSFVETNEHFYAEPLPVELKAAMARHDNNSLSMYLRYKRRDHELQPSDYSLQVLGAILIRAEKQSPWDRLRGVPLKSACTVDDNPVQVRWCVMLEPVDPSLRSVLQKIGLGDDGKLVVRVSRGKPQDRTSFVFRQDTHWIQLRTLSKHDAVPPGYSVAE